MDEVYTNNDQTEWKMTMNNEKHYHDHGHIELLNHIPDAERGDKVANTFSYLCDGTRIRILWLLCHSEECVNNIAKSVDMSAPAVSHHLKILREAGLITSKRIGKEIHYRLSDTDEAKLVHKMIDDIFEMKCNIIF